MNLKYTIVAVALLGLSTPALAAEFYVIQDKSTKTCKVVETKPAETTTMVVVGDKVYATKTEAENAIETITVCKSS